VIDDPTQLRGRLLELSRSPILLVACDYDGTLSPIVEDPNNAHPHRESVAALRALAAYPDTHVAVVSGRSLRDLAALSRLPSEIHLVGSHGSEFDAGFAEALDERTVALRETVTRALTEIAAEAPGFGIEKKPASVAFHYRNVDPDDADAAIAEILAGPAALEGVAVKRGKMVIELAVVETNKGTALDRLRRQVAADAVLFVGDDVTDEDAFATLHGPDLAIKVGGGETAAHARLGDTEDVARTLALLCELRRAWLEGENAPPIEEHSMLSDHRTVALVTPDARVTWMCHPRADSPAVFAELVGGPQAGYFAVRPDSGRPPISQRYLPGTMVLETRWPQLMVTDYLDVSDGGADRPPGPTELLRVLEGRGVAHIEFAPRLDYGRAATGIEVVDGHLVVRGVPRDIRLHAPGVTWTIVDEGPNQTAHGTVVLDGAPVVCELVFEEGRNGQHAAEPHRRSDTIAYWESWASALQLPDVAPNEVRRSAITLRALCHKPSGAMLAAATTSLPEVPGGVRNWDYRYCWPRDSALSAAALVALGSHDEATALLHWIHERIEHLPGPEHLRPLYPVAGDEYLPEAVLPTLNGYLGSRPVRIGNAADQQVQLDVFGPVVDLIWKLAEAGVPIDDETWLLVQDMVVAVSRRWHEPDHGIWEERRPQRHHVHSKVMCWVAVDRALRIGRHTGRHVPITWRPLRHTIAADVVSNGWNPDVHAYTIAYGDTELDAAVLWIGLSGLLPTTDPRFVATVKAIERELRKGPVVYRYRLDDGLPGDEGGFLICTAWLIEAYVLMGQLDDARTLFDRYLDLAGHTGLLSEEYEPSTGMMLGNHPQAYSHLGLINAALAIGAASS
jgi:trehalose-phosphatase